MIRKQKCGRNCCFVHRTEKLPAGRKAAFDGRNGCQKCFCVTFDESNKAYAPYPALITTRKGRKDID